MRYVRNLKAEYAKTPEGACIITFLNSRFFLKEDVKPDLLLKALNDALKLYPFFKFTLEQVGDEMYLADDDAPVSVYETDKIILPDGERLDGHLFFVGYSGRMVSISVDHRLSDGSGVERFFGKVFERYEALLKGNAEEITGPAYDIALMYQQTPNVPEGDYQKYEPLACEGKVIHLPPLIKKEPYRCFICRVNEDTFMNYVKKHETSAFAAIAQITDKGIFSMYPEGGDYIKSAFLVSTKKALGMDKSFAILTNYGAVDISRDEVDDSECLKRVRADIKGQISEENILYNALHPVSGNTAKLMMQSTYVCSYLRLTNEKDGIIERHQSIPLCYIPLPKLDVRASSGEMEFVVSGSPECEALYNAVKLGLEQTGFDILSESRQTIKIENGELTVTDSAD